MSAPMKESPSLGSKSTKSTKSEKSNGSSDTLAAGQSRSPSPPGFQKPEVEVIDVPAVTNLVTWDGPDGEDR